MIVFFREQLSDGTNYRGRLLLAYLFLALNYANVKKSLLHLSICIIIRFWDWECSLHFDMWYSVQFHICNCTVYKCGKLTCLPFSQHCLQCKIQKASFFFIMRAVVTPLRRKGHENAGNASFDCNSTAVNFLSCCIPFMLGMLFLNVWILNS